MRMQWLVFLAAGVLLAGCGRSDQETASAATIAAKPARAGRPAPVRPEDTVPPEVAAAQTASSRMVSAVSQGKPGASVDLKFDLPQRPEVGKPIVISLAVTPRMADVQTLQVIFQPTDGIEIRSGGDPWDLDRPQIGVPRLHNITIVPLRNGVFFLSAVALADTADGSLARAFSIPMIVGSGVTAAEKPAPTRVDPSGERVVSMPADESSSPKN